MLNTSLTVVNEIDVRGRALLELIKTYIQFPYSAYGFRPIGANPEIQYPALFVEPKSDLPQLATTGKFRMKWTFAIYWYVRANTPEQAVSDASWVGEALMKLLSNNALGDLGVAVPSNKFMQYPNPAGGYYWLDSNILERKYSVTYLDGEAAAPNYERAGRLLFEVEDVILV